MEGKTNSILIVDDSSLNLAALSQILSPIYKLYIEKDGLSCIESAVKNTPDLILLDIVMPGMNGFDVITELKKNTITSEIPVIFITGLDSAQDEEKGFVLGAADYISKPFTPAVVKLRVKSQIQIINQIRHINNISITDELTGIGNRRFFYAQLEQEWQRALRNHDYIAFLMMDIDKFKPYNDTYGHLQGDRALSGIAQIIKNSLFRAIDTCARWGGEEFAVILPDTQLNGAKEVAERIRTNVKNLILPLDDQTPTRVTVSIGVNCTAPTPEACSLKDFVSDTDKALYHAKLTGRNRACTVEDLK
jgi:diguanylate cyclase (GGDEF)-like protein